MGRVAAPDLVPEISISAGTISALRAGDNGERRVLQINSTINPGNSGGPVVDRDGYAVGVIRARVTGDAGIGFAIPINQAKDFLESRGLDSLMPAHRFRLGALQSFDGKGIALRMPEGVSDTSPLRSRVESEPGLAGVALANRSRLCRRGPPSRWSGRCWRDRCRSSVSRSRRVKARHCREPAALRSCIGRATGRAPGSEPDVRMQYGILELGAEKLVARYVGSAEQLAYNESVLRESLLSLEGQRLSHRRRRDQSRVSPGRPPRHPPADRTCPCRPAGSSSPVRHRCVRVSRARARSRPHLSGPRRHAGTSCGRIGYGHRRTAGGRRRVFFPSRVQRSGAPTSRVQTGSVCRTRSKAHSCGSVLGRSYSSKSLRPIRRAQRARALLAAWIEKAARPSAVSS